MLQLLRGPIAGNGTLLLAQFSSKCFFVMEIVLARHAGRTTSRQIHLDTLIMCTVNVRIHMAINISHGHNGTSQRGGTVRLQAYGDWA